MVEIFLSQEIVKFSARAAWRRTVFVVIHRHRTASLHSMTTLLDQAQALIDPISDVASPDSGRHSTLDNAALLTGAAWFALRQLQLVHRLAPAGYDVVRAIRRIMDRANDYGYASPSGVGAAAALMELVRRGDMRVVATTIIKTGATLGTSAVPAGSTALIASMCEELGSILSLDAVAVLVELRTTTGEHQLDCRPCDAPGSRLPVRRHCSVAIRNGR
jgi:hypothetical protein